jgi:hypothetical protein
MLALVSNTTVVPSAYAPALTAQVNALLDNPCASPPPPVFSPPPASASNPPPSPVSSPPPTAPPPAGLVSANLTLSDVSLSTFSLEALNSRLGASLPSGISAVMSVEDFTVSATCSLPITAAAFTPEFAALFAEGLARSLGVTVAQVSLGTVTSTRRLLSLLNVPFTVSSLGTDPAAATSVMTLISSIGASSSDLSIALAAAGFGLPSLSVAPSASVVTSLQFLAFSAELASGAAAALAAALPAVLPGAVMTAPVVRVAAVSPTSPASPATSVAVVAQPNEAGVNAAALSAMYTAALAVQCSHLTTPGVLDAVMALVGSSVACVPAAVATPPPAPPPALPPVSQVRPPFALDALRTR